jgi:hypothetical protein
VRPVRRDGHLAAQAGSLDKECVIERPFSLPV